MYLAGIINALDEAAMKARVQFPDKEGLVSDWLPVVSSFAQANRSYRMPDLGEQVACLMDENLEAGCIVGSIYGGSETPPEASGDVMAVHFSDGTIVRYDRAANTLSVDCSGVVQATAARLIGLAAPEIGFISAGALNMQSTRGGANYYDGTKIEYEDLERLMTIRSMGTLLIQALLKILVTAPRLDATIAGAVTLRAVGPVTVDAGGPVTVNGAGPVTVNAGGPISLNAGGDATVQAGGAVNLVGASVLANGKSIG